MFLSEVFQEFSDAGLARIMRARKNDQLILNGSIISDAEGTSIINSPAGSRRETKYG